MKTISILIALTLMLFFSSCEEEGATILPDDQSTEEGTPSQTEVTGEVDSEPYSPPEFLNTEYLGCFVNGEMDEDGYMHDTMYYEVIGDTLFLTINVWYNCCGQLVDSVAIDNDVVNIFIQDVCEGGGCECYCLCDFDFVYTFLATDYVHFFVYLKDLYDTEYEYWDDLYVE